MARMKHPEFDKKVEVLSRHISRLNENKPINMKKMLHQIEKDIILFTLNRLRNQTRAARFLGMKEQTLRYRMKILGIKPTRQQKYRRSK